MKAIEFVDKIGVNAIDSLSDFLEKNNKKEKFDVVAMNTFIDPMSNWKHIILIYKI